MQFCFPKFIFRTLHTERRPRRGACRATKVQTGGPDGDLGSNEIKISKDRTVGIVDGSGVAYGGPLAEPTVFLNSGLGMG